MNLNQPKHTFSCIRLIGCLTLGLITISVIINAEDGYWDNANSANWGDTTYWFTDSSNTTNVTTPPSTVNDTAYFHNNSFYGGGGKLTLADAGGLDMSITLGGWNHNAASAGRNITLSNTSGGTGSLTLENSTGTVTWFNSGAASNYENIEVDVILNSNVDFQIGWVSQARATTTFTSVISGTGGIQKSIRKSTLSLQGTSPNTFTGGVSINDGTISAEKSGALGTGNVLVEQTAADTTAQLIFASGISDAMSSSATLSLISFSGNYANVDLGSGVNQTIAGLFFDGASQAAGTWGASGSGATFENDDWFTGSGVITVIPEPSSILLLGIGFGLLTIVRRSRH
ncbi:PEP-CTERM sorting domain-containing protein [Kiritimatiellaeota bacterium B1221]|nr:PEP-CTERM sorting domain-containing protein [Kiritimatiellaeota bacterium B1221]